MVSIEVLHCFSKIISNSEDQVVLKLSAFHPRVIRRQVRRFKEIIVLYTPVYFLSLTDPSSIVAQSVARGKPIIFITFNYRLNIFAFGNGSELNLALKDQRLAIDWVTKHIEGFGGDKVCYVMH